ncbi:fibrobacter succinogenes major paralogous domain-containing protein, partial [Elizabethkingia anophelis]|uniref:fibrobacter succinogenes major paralogous domain-containing protein n=1 Tax=Elizabethkingia anophelis TaxID=1117645 RepID=UPI001C887C15
CPSGYRVPTIDQWKAVIANNNVERVGSWISNANNYTTAIYFRNSSNIRTLMLPTAGYRDDEDGSQRIRGFNGNYWSSGEYTSTKNGIYISFNSSNLSNYRASRMFGYSVRCIAE